MSNWLDLSNNANTFKSTYLKGFLDLSGGTIRTEMIRITYLLVVMLLLVKIYLLVVIYQQIVI